MSVPDYTSIIQKATDKFILMSSSIVTVDDLKRVISDILLDKDLELNIALPDAYNVYMAYSGSTGDVSGRAMALAATDAAPEVVANIEITAAGALITVSCTFLAAIGGTHFLSTQFDRPIRAYLSRRLSLN